MTKTAYYPFIDKLWLFSIIYIVWFHTPPRFEAGTDNIIWYIGVALFFFISGSLFHSDRLTAKDFVARQFHRLTLPSLVCYMAFYLLWVFFGRYHASIEDLEAQWYDPLTELVTGQPNLVAAPLWFIVTLLVIQGTTYIIRKKLPLSVLLLISVCITAFSSFIDINYFNIHFASVFFIWHTLGICFQHYLLPHVLTPGTPVKWITRIKAAGVPILAFQNYVIGCVKILLSALCAYDLTTAPLYAKFVVAAIAFVITTVTALVANEAIKKITYQPIIQKKN